MPTYEYACESCGHHFDLRQGFDAETTAECPKCKTESKRVIHVPFVVYNAPGFYTSDTRRSGPGNYWYNRERKDEEKATTDAKGTTEPTPEAPPPQTVAGPAETQSDSHAHDD